MRDDIAEDQVGELRAPRERTRGRGRTGNRHRRTKPAADVFGQPRAHALDGNGASAHFRELRHRRGVRHMEPHAASTALQLGRRIQRQPLAAADAKARPEQSDRRRVTRAESLGTRTSGHFRADDITTSVRTAQIDPSEIRRAFGLLTRSTRLRWAGLLPLALAGAAAEAIGALAVFALLRVIADPTSVDRLPVTSTLRRVMTIDNPRAAIVAVAALLAGVYVVRNALLTASAWARARVMYGSVAELSRRAYTAYLRAPFALAGARNSAAMIQRVQRASDVVPRLVLASVITIIAEVLVVAGLVLLLAVTAPLVTLLAVAGTACCCCFRGCSHHRCSAAGDTRSEASRPTSSSRCTRGSAA